MNPNTLTRQLFLETIKAIQAQFAHDAKCNEAFKTILPHDYVSGYDHSHVSTQLIKLLKVALNDNHKDSWIEYFIYELDFGAKYKAGMITERDGSEIDLSSAAKLWCFITR